MSALPTLGPPSNHTPASSNSGTFGGMFGHGRINVDDGWSWAGQLQQHSGQGEVREAELKRHCNLVKTERIRHPERFDHLKSTYERGVAGNEKVGHGTAAMGEYSKFEQIGSSSVRASNPISLDMDRTYAEENSKSWQQNRKNAYNPILQKYQDEIDCSSGRYGAVNNQAFAPTPPSQQQMLTQNQQQFVEGNSQRERVLRTRDWTPGRPKGGRTYREKTQNSTPILGDKPEEATLVENERIRQEYYDKEKDRYVRVFQVYPDVMKEVNAMRADAQQKDMEINKALDRRMIREGGYDPITLRDRRTGDSVGPLPDNKERHKMSAAENYAARSRTGAHVAYALGCDRHGDPEGHLEVEHVVNTVQVDHVAELMENEERVENGFHDLEERHFHPTSVQCLMDERYADQFKGATEEKLSWDNTQVTKNIYDDLGGAGRASNQEDYQPDLRAHNLLNCDTMTTWVPKLNAAYDERDEKMSFNKRQNDMYHDEYLHNGKGVSTNWGVVEGKGGVGDAEGIRLWPEKRKEISMGVPR